MKPTLTFPHPCSSRPSVVKFLFPAAGQGGNASSVAAGILPAVDPGVLPGGQLAFGARARPAPYG